MPNDHLAPTQLNLQKLLHAAKYSCLLLLLFITACDANPSLVDPTPLAPDAAQPAQSTPESVDNSEPVVIPTLLPTPFGSTVAENLARTAMPDTARFEAARVPVAAVGVSTGTTTLYATPGDSDTTAIPISSIPSGINFTVTGISANDQYYAVYTSSGQSGWIDVDMLTVFGGSDLATVTEPYQPSAVSTVLAQAMRPANAIDQNAPPRTPPAQGISVNAALATIEAEPTARASTRIDFALLDNFDAAAANGAIGLVQSEDDFVTVHVDPSTNSDVIGQVDNGQQVGVIGFNEDGSWFEVANLKGRGWVSSQYVVLE